MINAYSSLIIMVFDVLTSKFEVESNMLLLVLTNCFNLEKQVSHKFASFSTMSRNNTIKSASKQHILLVLATKNVCEYVVRSPGFEPGIISLEGNHSEEQVIHFNVLNQTRRRPLSILSWIDYILSLSDIMG